MNTQRANIAFTTPRSGQADNTGFVKNPLPEQIQEGVDHFRSSPTTNHDDALLLAAFADIANKTAPSANSLLEHKNQLNQLLPALSNQTQRYSAIQPRPRTVSDSSNNEQDSSSSSPSLASLPKKTPLEIQPQTPGERKTGRVFYRTILKKKFSWKNYPPLEKFLIANRDEYLRHSTLNYTVQQKQYNNHLTEQMIELAAQYGLVFDDNDFSFVTIRDRIRCYYKSYVQSLKKRGILLGYAARKAGLVSDNDIEVSASTAGKIYLPKV